MRLIILIKKYFCSVSK